MTQHNYDPLQDLISTVELKSHMGDDLMVVNAARVSMHKESEWETKLLDIPGLGPTRGKYLSAADTGLINYLAKHNHWTPFSHPQVQLRIKMPIFVARQWYKHMTGFTRNEVSRRYVDDRPEVYLPKQWRMKAANVKQGSSDDVFPGIPYILEYIKADEKKKKSGFTPNAVYTLAVKMYNSMIEQGICAEQARMVLPQSMYTEFIETGSLAAYSRLCKLRLDPHAQKEVRVYAEAVAKIMASLFPVSWPALQENN